ncbi:MAG: hypothetical protein KFH87_12145, partial [Bacteroidetes bacterium]|nr:hypothetical protein [Bacteroidota bacterium]
SVVTSQFLKFPIRTLGDEGRRARVNRWITIVIILTITPSIYFGYLLVQKERFTTSSTRFIRAVSLYEGNFLLSSEVRPESRSITLPMLRNERGGARTNRLFVIVSFVSIV